MRVRGLIWSREPGEWGHSVPGRAPDAGLYPQNALVSFKELCGLTPAANMKQCILTVAAWLLHSDSSPSVTLNLAEKYPQMEAQGPIPDLLRKVLTAYETVSAVSHRGPTPHGDAPWGQGHQDNQDRAP